MSKYISYFASCIFLTLVYTHAIAEVIDPEKYIQKNGYQSVITGDDGKTLFYNFTETAELSRITALESEIEKLPKHVDIQKFCDFMRGATKAKLIKKRGIAIDVAVVNYGYSGSTVACTLKFCTRIMLALSSFTTKRVRMVACIESLSRNNRGSNISPSSRADCLKR